MTPRMTMTRRAKEYLQYRRAFGFALSTDGRLLMGFAHFADHQAHCGPLTTELALRWVSLPAAASQSYRAKRLSVVRGFARYLATRDGRTQVPATRLLGPLVCRRQPHIYSDGQLRQLVLAAAQLKPAGSLRPKTYSTFLGLLACTGMRISEALKLTRDSVDLNQGILRIDHSKFGKSRLVPLHPTAIRAMRRYAQERDCSLLTGDSEAFFVGQRGRPLTGPGVRQIFGRLRQELSLCSNGAMPRPRIHDLRHSFACRRLLAWYRQGIDVNHAIAALSTYLGHGQVKDTYWYLTGTPQLRGIAADRFERWVWVGDRRRL